MISHLHKEILSVFLVFCRIGSCIMFLPGFSAACIPVQVRLYFSIAFSIIILPFLWDVVYPNVSGLGPAYILLIVIEILIGSAYGIVTRIYALGLQFSGTIISTMIGLNVASGIDISENTVGMPVAVFIGITGLLMLLAMDFHHDILYALVQSYSVIPVGGEISSRINLVTFVNVFQETFYIMLRLSSPFIIFNLIFNISVGLLNKLVPQVFLYIISLPVMLGIGFFLLYLSISFFLHQFVHSFRIIF
ncbi:Flagellar biosynthesis protein FliR [Liberibacter crescens BT-1]|uniref:Flagellar biosynthetic protein FliR n=1 Tax=Liberibacter crescens (strain BT-1) TaxID=1215343 RepID=L0EVP4_LIBCB|nr:flagellar biosynthetic protein FliR [Liberibacter crescens]AGA64930.1 Flagellar biosynthesis protein FliR [Liberibacter crescens BT-1]AMC12953.1 flagellar biosynthesis protein FliR [Liberibacter crescens]